MSAPNDYRDPYWSDLATQKEREHGLPPGLLRSVVVNGEQTNADRVSSAGARSPFQVIPATRDGALQKWGVDAYKSPEAAADVAARVLRDSLDRNKGHVPSAVAEYVGGLDRSQHGPITQSYVGRVLKGMGDFFSPTSAIAAEAPAPEKIAQWKDAYSNGRMSPTQAADFELDFPQYRKDAGAPPMPVDPTASVQQITPGPDGQYGPIEMPPEPTPVEQGFLGTPQDIPPEFVDQAGAYLKRKKDLITETFSNVKQATALQSNLGELIRNDDPDWVNAAQWTATQMPQQKIVPESPFEKGLSFMAGLPAQILNPARIEEGAQYAKDTQDSVLPWLITPAGTFLVGATTGFDQATSAGALAMSLLQFKDPETGQGIDPKIIRMAALSGGAIDASLQYVGINALKGLTAGVIQQAGTVAKTEAAKILSTEFGKKTLNALLALGRDTLPITAPIMAQTASDLIHEKVAMEVNNKLKDAGVEWPDADYAARRLKEGAETALYGSLGLTLAARLAGGAIGRMTRTSTDSVYTREQTALERYVKPEEYTKENAPPRPSPDAGIVERIAPEEHIARNSTAEAIAAASPEKAAAIIENELLTRDGKPSGVTTEQYRVKKQEITQITKELYGWTSPEKVVAPSTPAVAESSAVARARLSNTFSGQARDAGRRVGYTQPPGTPPEKLFANFADTKSDQVPSVREDFRAKMLLRANRGPAKYKNDTVLSSSESIEGLEFKVDAAEKGNTRVQVLSPEGRVIAAARMEAGMLDSIAVDASVKGQEIGRKLLSYIRDNKLGNVEEVPDRSPGFVNIQRRILAETAPIATPDPEPIVGLVQQPSTALTQEIYGTSDKPNLEGTPVFRGVPDKYETLAPTDKVVWVTNDRTKAEAYAGVGPNATVHELMSKAEAPLDLGFRDTSTHVKIEDITSRLKKNVMEQFEQKKLDIEPAKALIARIDALQASASPQEMKRVYEWWNSEPEVTQIAKDAGFDSIISRESENGVVNAFGVLDPSLLSPAVTKGTVGLVQQLSAARKQNSEMRAAKVKTTDPERAAVIAQIDDLKTQVTERKAALEEAKHQAKMMYEPRVVGQSEEALIQGKIAVDTAKELGSKGWLEEEEMSKESFDEFRKALTDANRDASKARTAGDREGFARGQARIRQLIDAKRRRMNATVERNAVIKDINKKVREGAKPSGVLTAEANDIFLGFKKMINMSKEDAAALSVPGVETAPGVANEIARGLLRLKAESTNLQLNDLHALRDAVYDVFDNANFDRFEQLQVEQMRLVKVKSGVLTELAGPEHSLVLATARALEFKSPLDDQPLSIWGRIRRNFEAPGWGAIGAWRGFGKVLMTDPYKDYDTSVIGKLFETIEPEKAKIAGVTADTRELYSIISDAFEIPSDGKDERAIRQFVLKEVMATPEPVLAADGSAFMIVDDSGKAGVPLAFTRFERIQRAMELFDPGVRKYFLEKRGYTSETIAAIQNLGDQDTRYMKLRFSFYQRMHDKVDAVFAAKNGYHLRKSEFYVPRMREGFETESGLSPLLRDMFQEHSDAQHSSRLRERDSYSEKPVKRMNALSADQLYIRDMNHYVAWADKMSDLNNVLRDIDVTDTIRARFGDKVGKDIIKAMSDHLDTLGRGYVDYLTTRNTLDFVIRNVVKAQMAGKVLLGVKQLNSVFLYGEEQGLGIKEFMTGLAEFMRHPKEAIKFMDDRSAYIKERGLDIDPSLSLALEGVEPAKWDPDGRRRFMINEVSNMLLSPIHYGDKGAIYAGGYILYRHLVQSMSPEEAMSRVEAFTRDTQQSMELSTQSKWQRDKSPMARIATTYSTATFSMMRRCHDATLDLVRSIDEVHERQEAYTQAKIEGDEGKTAGAKADYEKAKINRLQRAKETAKIILLFHVLNSVVYTLAGNLGDPDALELLAAGIFGPLTSLPVVETFEAMIRSSLGLKARQGGSAIEEPLKELGTAGATVFKAMFDDDFEADWEKFGRSLVTGSEVFHPLPARQAYDVLDKAANEEFGQMLLILFGSSKGVVEKAWQEE